MSRARCTSVTIQVRVGPDPGRLHLSFTAKTHRMSLSEHYFKLFRLCIIVLAYQQVFAERVHVLTVENPCTSFMTKLYIAHMLPEGRFLSPQSQMTKQA